MNLSKKIDSIKQESIRKSKSSKRTILKSQAEMPVGAISGKVVEVGTKRYVVEYINSDNQLAELNCFVAGSLVSPYRLSSLICCGDNVQFITYQSNDDTSNTGTIIAINERKTKLSRIDPANNNREHVISANIEHLLIVMSAFDPILNFRLIDRLIVAAMLGKLKVAICINKIDLAEIQQIDDLFEPYRSMDIPIFFVSFQENIGIDELHTFLNGKDTVLVGMSGVGKSTLLNNILGEEVQKVLEISESSGKGRHTTSFIKRFKLPLGGNITDTPGIREFGLWDLQKDELGLFFPDFFEFYPDCKYLSCTHTHEPNCKVKESVEKGLVSFERYQSYLHILETLDELQTTY